MKREEEKKRDADDTIPRVTIPRRFMSRRFHRRARGGDLFPAAAAVVAAAITSQSSWADGEAGAGRSSSLW